MGFHCGNTPACKMCDGRAVKYQLIQNRLLEDGGTPDFTRGTLEETSPLRPLPSTACSATPRAGSGYIAQGEVLPVATGSFGGIGIFAIHDMGRFYRHVLLAKRYPHHGAVAFSHCGREMYEVFRYLGVTDIAYNQPASLPYPARILLHAEPPPARQQPGGRNFPVAARSAQIERSNLVEICILSDITDKIPLMILFLRCICDILGPVMEKGLRFVIPREMYMSRIRPFIGSELIKVMTGIRRCGKSVMLELIKQELTSSGICPSQFISINFENMGYAHLQTAKALHDEILKRAAEIGGKVYLFFDEIQEVKDWGEVRQLPPRRPGLRHLHHRLQREAAVR